MSDERRNFAALAAAITKMQAGTLDPRVLDVTLVNFALSRLRALERLLPNDTICLRSEIDAQLKRITPGEWSEKVRTQVFDDMLASLDDFLGSNREKRDGLPRTAHCLQAIVKGFNQYLGKTHRR